MEYIPYIIMTILAVILGQLAKHLSKKMPAVVAEEITYKEFFSTLWKDFKIDIKYTLIFIILFNLLIYFVGNSYISYLYALVIFALSIAFSIDYRIQLLPDEVYIFVAICGVINLLFNLGDYLSYILGAIAGGGIFYLLGLLSIVIFKKEGMGFGDVKLMAAIGLLFGLKNILVIALLAFFIGAVISVILMIFKSKKMDSYIPFGPFIVIATILLMFIPADEFIRIYVAFCSMLSEGIMDVIYFFVKK